MKPEMVAEFPFRPQPGHVERGPATAAHPQPVHDRRDTESEHDERAGQQNAEQARMADGHQTRQGADGGDHAGQPVEQDPLQHRPGTAPG